MKSELSKDRRYIECSCYDPEHLFMIESDKSDKTVFLFFTGNWHAPFWRRLKYGLGFIFRSKKFKYKEFGDTMIIDKKNRAQLKEALEELLLIEAKEQDEDEKLKVMGERVWKEETEGLTLKQKELLKSLMWERDFYSEQGLRNQIKRQKELLY